MKKILFVASMLLVTAMQAQEMKEVFKKEIDHSFDYTGHCGDGCDYVYASSQKEITVMNTADGSMKWNKKYKEISPELGKVDEIIALWEADVLFVFDRKMGADKMACIDIKTGKLLWITSKYQNVEEENVVFIKELGAFAVTTKASLVMIKAKTGEEMWQTSKFKGIVGDYIITTDGFMVMINMKSSVIGSLFTGFKNQIVKINVNNGDVVWDQIYRGLAERKVLTKELLVDIQLKEDKVFLYCNGIQVFSYADGKSIWAAAFDQTPDVVRKPANCVKFGAYGVVADPVVVGNYVYVLDIGNKRSQYVKKYELLTGKLVWTSPEIKDARAIPGMYVVNGKVLLQVGGTVEVQYVTRERQPDNTYVTTTVIEGQNVKPYNVQCFDAESGKQIWESEKLKKGITNTIVDGSNAIICSGKALYSFDIATGKENYEIPLNKDNIGLADEIVTYKDNVAIIGEKGVSMRRKSDADYKGSAKYKRSKPLSYNGDVIYGNALGLVTPKSDIGVFDLDKMELKKYDARKGATSYLSRDGNALFVLESGGLIRKSKFTRLDTKQGE